MIEEFIGKNLGINPNWQQLPTATILAFDFGKKRIGVAVGKNLTKLARPLQTIHHETNVQRFSIIEKLIQTWQPVLLVVRMPLHIHDTRQLGDVPDTTATAAAQQLSILRDESRRRLRALTERPPEGAIPSQFLSLAHQSRHAIAVDASRSRLYLFENQTPSGSTGGLLAAPPKLKLLGDFYISVGLSGIEKEVEGDKRTPLGVYYITSNLHPDSLPDLYGVGALPINYPNPLDMQRGKTGSGIWLHGTPREQFVRAPQASDGCLVLSNPDLERLLSTVQIRTTPVVIAPELQWVQSEELDAERRGFETALASWQEAKSTGQNDRLSTFYSSKLLAGSGSGGGRPEGGPDTANTNL